MIKFNRRSKPVRLAATAILFAATLCSGVGDAATSTTTFNVTITITSQCLVSNATNMAFGSSGLLNAAVNQTSTFSVTCTNTTPYTVGLDSGQHVTGAQRRMMGGATNSEFVSYNLYSDTNRSIAWGNVSGSWVSGTGNGAAQTLTVYGQVPAQSTPSAAANYTDTVTITVTY